MFLVGAFLRFGSAAWVFHIVACMGGCLGCDSRPKLTSSVNGPSEEQGNCALRNLQVSQSEDFWTASACEMDVSAPQSCTNVSSSDTPNQSHDARGASCSSDFVNHGLVLWNQTRQKWTGNKRCWTLPKQLQEPKLSWNATYDSLLGSNKPFSRPIPLGEMADFLVDVWEQEGMYD